jgi:hypothetical protein
MLGVVGVNGALSYGVSLASAWILQVEWAWLDCMCYITSFMIIDISSDIFSCGTWVFVYSLVHVMCLCVCEYGMSAMYVV